MLINLFTHYTNTLSQQITCADYSPVGHMYSNTILQALLVLISKEPPDEVARFSRLAFNAAISLYFQEKKLLILGTTSKRDVLEALELTERFSAVLRLPTITKSEELSCVLAEIEVKAARKFHCLLQH